MPTVNGSGKWQTAILSTLDGQPMLARELFAEIVGGQPTPAQHSAAWRAAHLMVSRGQLLATYMRPDGRGYRLLVLRKVDYWVGDHDAARCEERERVRDPLGEFVDAAWAAFATDCGYAADIASAAATLARHAGRSPAAFDRANSDSARGREPGPPKVRPRASSR